MPPKWQPALRHLPNALSLFRLACGPMLVATHWEARQAPRSVLCLCSVASRTAPTAHAARKHDLCSVFGAELDGRADTCTHAAMVVVSLRWYAVELRHQLPLIVAAVLSHRRSGRWYASSGDLLPTTVTGKLWGCSLFFACLVLFASDGRKAPDCAWLACTPGLLNNAHEISMSCVLDEWTPEVLHIGHALKQQRLRRPFGFVAPPTVCEWAPTGLGRSARFAFLATNVAYFAAAWSLQGWPRLGVGALAAVSTIFHCVQTGCCGCLRGPLWTHRLSRCDIALASAVAPPRATIGAGRHPLEVQASTAPLGQPAAAAVLFAVAIACRKRRHYNLAHASGIFSVLGAAGALNSRQFILPSPSFIIDVRHRHDIVFMPRRPSPRAHVLLV